MKLALKNDSYFSVPEGEINVSVIILISYGDGRYLTDTCL